jgi:hypothetical protein
VAAGTRRLQGEGQVDFLAGPDLEKQALAALKGAAAPVEVVDGLRVDQVAVVLQEPRRPVGIAPRLLVGGEGDDDVPRRLEALPPQPHQGLGQGRVAVLHVDRAPAIEEAILLRQREGIDRPVLGAGLHHVEVADEQDRPALALARVADHQIALGRLVIGRQEQRVGPREASGEKARADRLGRRRRAVGVRGVGLHQVLEDRPRLGRVGRRWDGAGRRLRQGEAGGDAPGQAQAGQN